MKKLFIAATLLSATLFIGCNSGGGDPKAVLVDFFDALTKKDMAAARKLATSESKSMLDLIEMGMKMGDNKNDMEKYDKTKMEFGEPKIEGDKATVSVKEKGSGESTNFILKKESGSWKVAFDKASMGGMVMDKMKEGTDSLSSGMDKLNDINFDSLGDKMKQGLEKLGENKDKLEEMSKKLEEAAQKLEQK